MEITPTPTSSLQSVAAILPFEILQQVFAHLHPQDFESARNACAQWKLASLSKQTLQMMAQKSGWGNCHSKIPLVSTSQIHQASSLLEREAVLADRACTHDRPSKTYRDTKFHQVVSLDFSALTERTKSKRSFDCLISTDTHFLLFTQGCVIYVYHLDPSRFEAFMTPIACIQCPRKIVSVSMDASSGRHSVAALLEGRIACICNLEDELAVHSRTLSRWRSPGSLSVVQVDSTHQSVVLYNASFEHDLTERGTRRPCRRATTTGSTASEGAYEGLLEMAPVPYEGNDDDVQNATEDNAERGVRRRLYQTKDPELTCFLPIAHTHAPVTLYTSIGSVSDPPRSLALCPTRRSCVAFGCAEGVQLHWLESPKTVQGRNVASRHSPSPSPSRSPTAFANLRPSPASPSSTGSNRDDQSPIPDRQMHRRHLMKWFPLSAPSDYLRFVPGHGHPSSPCYFTGPRCHNCSNPQRLRLVSSVDLPQRLGAPPIGGSSWVGSGDQNSIWTRLTRWARGSMAIHSVSTGASSTHVSSNNMDTYDHYRAQPLSDGVLVLFVDPKDGMLTLGRDGPATFGPPARLERLVKFLPPHFQDRGPLGPEHEDSEVPIMPTHYTPCWDMQWGLRIAVAFRHHFDGASPAEEDVVVYTVPPDVIRAFGVDTKSKQLVMDEPWWGFWPGNDSGSGIRYAHKSYQHDSPVSSRRDEGRDPDWSETVGDCQLQPEPDEDFSGPIGSRSSCTADYVLHATGVQVTKAEGSQVVALDVWNADGERGESLPEIVIFAVLRSKNGLRGVVWSDTRRRRSSRISLTKNGGVLLGGENA